MAARAGADPHATQTHDPQAAAGGPTKADQKAGVQPLLTPVPATSFSTEMAIITGNAGGTPQQIIPSLLNGGQYCFISNVLYSGQAMGSIIGVARLPVPYTMIAITILNGQSLGTATVALGRADDPSNSGFWAAASSPAVQTPVSVGLYASLGVPQYVGVDSITGQPAGYQPGHQGGGQYDDVIMTVGAAALPGAGAMRLFFEYII
jgi:hypothetical protein